MILIFQFPILNSVCTVGQADLLLQVMCAMAGVRLIKVRVCCLSVLIFSSFKFHPRLGGFGVFQPKPVNEAHDGVIVTAGQQTIWLRLKDIYEQKQWGY